MMEVKRADTVIHSPACTSIKVMAIKLPVHRAFIAHFKIVQIFRIIYCCVSYMNPRMLKMNIWVMAVNQKLWFWVTL